MMWWERYDSLLSDFDPEAGDDRMRMFPFSITP